MWTSYKRLLNDVNVHSIICVAYKSHYEALNISKTATHKEIKDAYYRLSMIYHPDKNKGSEEAVRIFRDITRAYEVLGNVRQRKLYDSGVDPNQKTSQCNPQRPFETKSDTNVKRRDHIFDAKSKAQYSDLLQRQHLSRAKVERKNINIEFAERQHTYSYLTITIFISCFLSLFLFDYRIMFTDNHDRIKKSSEKTVTNN